MGATMTAPYTVQELAGLAGVSVRTLHHYHHIGLLPPARVGDNGYRYYGEAELVRLQQILFFRELELPLGRIRELMDQPDLDRAAVWRDHRRLLMARRGQLDHLIATLDRQLLFGEDTMTTCDPAYRSPADRFTPEEEAALREEARERWGDTDGWRRSEEVRASETPERAQAVRRQMDDALFRVVAHMDEGVGAPAVQAAVADYRAGMGHYYAPDDDVFGHIARMYVDDDRFAETFRRYHPDLPVFLRDAILHALWEQPPR